MEEANLAVYDSVRKQTQDFCAAMRVIGFNEDIDIIVDKNGKAVICVEGRFFRLEKSDEEIEELRTWE